MSSNPAPKLNPDHAPAHGENPEEESLPVGKIAAISIICGVTFALGILWAVQIMDGVVEDNTREFGPAAKAEHVGKAEIGIVDQTLFSVEKRAAVMAQEKKARLEGYGWVSRKDGTIHIPISEAMKAVLEGKRAPKGAPSQQGTAPATPDGGQGAQQGSAPTAPPTGTDAAQGGAAGAGEGTR